MSMALVTLHRLGGNLILRYLNHNLSDVLLRFKMLPSLYSVLEWEDLVDDRPCRFRVGFD
jgi:hypothetical protein